MSRPPLRLLSVIALAVVFSLGLAAPAAARPVDPRSKDAKERLAQESPEKRMERLGTQVDPGFDPDPEEEFIRFGRRWNIHKYNIIWARFDAPAGMVRPRGDINVIRELYDMDDEHVWIWEPVRDPEPVMVPVPAESRAPQGSRFQTLDADGKKAVHNARKDFSELFPLSSDAALKFRESSNGLPDGGSWRNTLDVADMNGDGFLDLIVPPQRGGGSVMPHIFLGDGKGNWTDWEDVSFPRGLNYGSVAAADLNKDGHIDLVFGVHLQGVVAFLGDGKGNFTDVSNGLPDDFPTRRAIITDLNADGWPDIVTLTEGPTMHQTSSSPRKIRAFINEKKGTQWREVLIAEAERTLGGDWLVAANLNGDKYPDLAGSSIYFNSPDVMFLSTGNEAWKAEGRGELPFWSMYFALTHGQFSSNQRDDLILSYIRAWPRFVDPAQIEWPELDRVVGLERVSFDRSGKMVRTPIMRWEGERGVTALGQGDFNGDGHADIVFVRAEPRELVFLLGDGKGGFRKAGFEGIDLPENMLYDIKVTDLTGNGRPDVIMMFESLTTGAGKDGSIRVFLNETPAARPAARRR
jgi:hypothetical protein